MFSLNSKIKFAFSNKIKQLKLFEKIFCDGSFMFTLYGV